ncbi:hypothetical protein HMPREF0185_01109 [Brevundimonas diminuta 470-4]|nr:hypothetical protein HMPREF0185_01109 [Brevundimonas diminuta 470-4]
MSENELYFWQERADADPRREHPRACRDLAGRPALGRLRRGCCIWASAPP